MAGWFCYRAGGAPLVTTLQSAGQLPVRFHHSHGGPYAASGPIAGPILPGRLSRHLDLDYHRDLRLRLVVPLRPPAGRQRSLEARRGGWAVHGRLDRSQSRIVYLVRLISIWYCKWFMLFMTLDMPDEGTGTR